MMMFSWTFVLPLANLFNIRPRQLAPVSEQHAINGMEAPTLAFSGTWSLLGPFQIGTRGNYTPTLPFEAVVLTSG
jgi:hypothetical protein